MRESYAAVEAGTVKRVFITDCEGPISKNDNAYELTAKFVPNGDKVFSVISKYDDVLADVVRKPGYSAGSTLKLVLPFLKAYDVTNEQMQEFSRLTLCLIANTKDTLRHIVGIAHAYMVSTSYEHYVSALCKATDFPFEHAYCTRVSLNKYNINEKEKTKLKAIAEEIAHMPIVNIPANAESTRAFSDQDQEIIARLDEIFWSEIQAMRSGKIFSDVVTVGGPQKAEAIEDAADKSCAELSDVMYVGDSITDVEAFKLTRENYGLAVSFNGNRYAIKNAEVAVLSENNLAIAVLADVFCKAGKQQVLKLVETWSWEALEKSVVNPLLLQHLFRLHPEGLPKVQIVTAENMEHIVRDSSEFRKKVRGEAIGGLG